MHKTAKCSLFIIIAMLGAVILLLPVATFAQNGEGEEIISGGGGETAVNQPHAPVVTYTHTTYLPLIMTPPISIQSGDIKLFTGEGAQAKGVTVFKPEFTLDFSDLNFSHTPISMTISGDAGWEPNPTIYSITQAATLTNVIPGVKQINVTFIRGDENVSQSFTFFYIPNGDFNDATEGEWKRTDGEVNRDSTSDTWILGKSVDVTCPSAEIRTDSIMLENIQLPPSGSGYHLRVQGTVYTRDQNPSNDNTYDAFEIFVDGNFIQRYSNPDSPISCSIEKREIPVDTWIPLNNYAGEITLSLENHLRFDQYFNTYTEIDTVWIE